MKPINVLSVSVSGMALALFLAPGAASAQEAAAAPASAAPAATPAAASEAAAATATGDIIVTAQRRAERAQNVPVVVTAFSPERLQQLNVTQPQDLYGNVPSLTVGNQGQATRDVQSYAIRGQSTGFLASPAVAVYFNEVPLPASISLSLQGGQGNLVDLENVQVLSGPQGTLFGRNTTGGAVLLTPAKPTNKLEGYLEGKVGNYALKSIEGAINVPIIDDVLMVRASGAYYDRRGFTRDVVFNKWRDNQHWYSGRIGIMFKPAAGLSNYTLLYGSNSSNNGSGFIHEAFNIGATPNDGLQGVGFCVDPPTAPPGPSGIAVSCDVYRRQTQIAQQLGPRKTAMDVDEFSRIKARGLTNTTAYEISDQVTVRNIFSYQRLKDNYAADQDATPLQQYELVQNANFPTSAPPGLAQYGLPPFGYIVSEPNFSYPRDYIKQVTEELQVQGSALDRHVTYTAGGFYYNATPVGLWGSNANNYCPAAFTGACAFSKQFSGVSNKSKALYAQGSLDFGAFTPTLDTLKLTGGFRYTWDTISGFNYGYSNDTSTPGNVVCTNTSISVPAANAPLADPTGCRVDATLHSKAPTWTIGLDYKPIRNVLVYAKITRGYKSGGFNTFSVRDSTRTFQPEKLLSYEAGFKSDFRLASMPVQLNATYYYSDYNNIQRPSGDVNPPASGAQILGAKARIQGVEVEALIRPTRGLEIGGTLSYTDAKYKKFTQIAVVDGTPSCNGPVNTGQIADYTCRPFQFVTPWIFNVHASYDLPIADRLGRMTLFVNYVHVSSQPTAPLAASSSEPGSVIAGFGLLNASLDWRGIAGSDFDAGLFVTNATNKLYRTSNSNTFSNGQLLAQSTIYGEPRMFGLKLRYHFGS